MFEQGCSRLPADESGRILDRLVGLEKCIAPELITQALAGGPITFSGWVP